MRIPASILALALLTACADIPDVGAEYRPAPRPLPWPEIVPLAPLLEEAAAAAPSEQDIAQTDALIARADALRRAAQSQ